MATLANILATRNHVEPTAWKSPTALMQEQEALKQTVANTAHLDSVAKQQQFETQTAIDALREQKARQRALMDSMSEAGDDLNKVGTLYATKTGDRAGAENWIKTISQAQADAAKAKNDDLAGHVTQGKAISQWLHGGVQSANGNPDAFQIYVKQNLPALTMLGIDPKAIQKEWLIDPDSAEAGARSLDAGNIIATEELKKRELGVQEGNLAVNQQNANRQTDEQKAKTAEANRAKAGQILSSVGGQAEYDAWRKEFPEESKRMSPFYNPKMVQSALKQYVPVEKQMQFENQDKPTMQKEYEYLVESGALDPSKTSPLDYEKIMANLRTPKTSVTTNVNTKELGEGAITKISDGISAIESARELRDLLGSNKSITGPITGWRTSNPWDVEAQSIQGAIDLVKQRVGKAFEGGVLRKEDEEKYKKILPTVFDTPESARNKIENVIRALERDTKNFSDMQSRSGRRVDMPEGATSEQFIIEVGGKKYRYKGSGATDDMKSYSEVKP